jgi:serine/threonine-protein kinase RsbT
VAVVRHESRPVRTDQDVVAVRQLVREWSIAAGFGLVDQTKMVTAASELVRNAVTHGGGGTARLELLNSELRRGLRLVVEDEGPGIADLGLALRDGYSTGGGLGLGLGGAKRLANEFELDSRPGEGTRVAITRWR